MTRDIENHYLIPTTGWQIESKESALFWVNEWKGEEFLPSSYYMRPLILNGLETFVILFTVSLIRNSLGNAFLSRMDRTY